MHVAGPILDGLQDDEVREFDDRGLFARRGEFVQIDVLDRFTHRLDGIPVRFGIGPLLRILNEVFHRAAFGGFNGVLFFRVGLFGSD